MGKSFGDGAYFGMTYDAYATSAAGVSERKSFNATLREMYIKKRSCALSIIAILPILLFGYLPPSSIGAVPESVATKKFVQAAKTTTPSAEQKARTKVAQGEYVIIERANGGAVGPFGEEVFDFHETWTLWQDAKGQYEVEGERRFESPKSVPHVNRFLVELSRDRTVIRLTEFTRLKWRRDSGPLTCDFLQSELRCSSHARETSQAVDLRVPMKHPFGLLWPISAFSLSGITRETERDPAHESSIQLVSVQQPSADIPVSPMVLDGKLQYLGEENVEVAGQEQRALKFSFKVALQPGLLIWTSPKGFLLALAFEHEHKDWPAEGMKLLHFQQWDAF